MIKGYCIAGRNYDDGTDFYQTPEWATRELLEAEIFEGKIWECCSGNGAISRVLKDYEYDVISSDIREDALVYGKSGVDFLKCEMKVDNIVTNPPYKIALPIIEKALELANNKVAMLLKLTFLESRKRYPFFTSNHNLKHIHVFSKRVTMYPYGMDKPKNSGTITYAWFVWDKSYNGSPMIRWIY